MCNNTRAVIVPRGSSDGEETKRIMLMNLVAANKFNIKKNPLNQSIMISMATVSLCEAVRILTPEAAG